MINSLHTYETFKRILDAEEKQGRLKKDYFSEEIQNMSAELKKLRTDYKRGNKNDKPAISERIEELKAQYEEKRDTEIKQLTDKILKGDFEIKLREVDANDKTGYATDNVETMLLSKVLMLELKRSYKHTPANRNNILEELQALLDNPMPKIVVRADIHEFFESIPQNNLMDKIIEDSYISAFSIKCLKTFIYLYNKLSDNLKAKEGIPRGLSFSSYLAEIYLSVFDRKVMQTNGVYFYKRYVDDIIILANPDKIDKQVLWNAVEKEAHQIGLSLSEKEDKRTCELMQPANDTPIVVNYLGYQFRYTNGKLDLLLTEKKFNRYKTCVKLAFEKYKEIGNHTSRKTEDKRQREDATIQFMHRLNALTGNGHLNGRKNFVLVGIFYSNKYLTSLEQFKELDSYINECLEDSNLFNPSNTMFQYSATNNYQKNVTSIKEKIVAEYSFEKGFKDRRLYQWNDYPLILHQLGNLYYSQQNNE